MPPKYFSGKAEFVMYKRIIAILLAVLCLSLLGCSKIKGAVKSVFTPALSDGLYEIEVTLEGGTGRASVKTPTMLEVMNGKMSARIEWSSDNYDYMIVDGEKYYPEIEYHHSVFDIPVAALNRKITVTADTTAMSTPHEIEYTLYFDSSTVKNFE